MLAYHKTAARSGNGAILRALWLMISLGCCGALTSDGEAQHSDGEAQRSDGSATEKNAASATAVVPGNAPAAQQEAHERARNHYERALVRYNEGAFDAALAELLRAYALRPSPSLYYNIAQVQRARGDYAAALLAFNRYLHEGGQSVPEARRSEVVAQLHELESFVARMYVRSNVAGAQVLVDQELRGLTPLNSPLLVNAGPRLLVVRREGYGQQEQRVVLAGGDVITVRVELGTEAPMAVSPGQQPSTNLHPAAIAPAPTVEPSSVGGPVTTTSKADLRPYLGWGATLVLGVGAGAFGWLANAANDRLAEERNALEADPKVLDDKATQARAFALVSDGLLLSTLVMGGLSLWWTLDDSDEEEGAPSARLELGLNGVQFTGSY